MVLDNNLQFGGLTGAQTATFSSSALDLKTKPPTPRRGFKAKYFYSSMSNSSSALPTITAASTANPAIITSASHGVTQGQIVAITGAASTGAPANSINPNPWNGAFIASAVTTNTITLQGCNGTTGGTYTSGSATGYLGNQLSLEIDGSNNGTNWDIVSYSENNPNGAGIQGLVIAPFAIPGQTGEGTISFDTNYEFVRVTGTIGSGGTSPTVVLAAYIQLGRP